MNPNEWNKFSWRSFPIQQQPLWPDIRICEDAINKLSNLPSLVFAGETRALKQQLAEVVEGKAFILQAGDCAEEFSRCNGSRIHDLLKVILKMSIILAYAGEKKVIKIGRMAGQYAKPRSSNGANPTSLDRTPDPNRMIEGYFRATATLNLMRAFTRGGYASLDRIKSWSDASFGSFPDNKKYDNLVMGIRKSINFLTAIGLDVTDPQLNEITMFTSHEALLLEYEEALTRIDTTTGKWYDTSAHMVWIGDRTRQIEGAHVEFLSGVCNPIGVKIGPNHDIENIKSLIRKLNQDNDPGRLTLITRFGAGKIEKYLPQLLREIKREGFSILWSCDPMHGNTYINKFEKKTRNIKDILKEIKTCSEIHHSEGTFMGGVHLELTGDNVTECIGGNRDLLDKDLDVNYLSTCDPRLNAEQAVELAFEVAEILRS